MPPLPGASYYGAERRRAAGGWVPYPHDTVAVDAGQQLAVRAERHLFQAGLSLGGNDGGAGGRAGERVPQPHGAVVPGGGRQVAPGVERDSGHTAWNTEGRADRVPGERVPQPYGAVGAGGG